MSDRSGYVYVIRDEGRNLLKVGHSVDPTQRLGALQTGNPSRLAILHTLFIRDDAGAVEASARGTLARWNVLNEWFDVTPDVAIAALYGAASRLGQLGDARDVERATQVSWPARIGLVALAFMPCWLAMGAGVPLLAFPFGFLALIALTFKLLRIRAAGPVRMLPWMGALIGGLAASIAAALILVGIVSSAIAQTRDVVPKYDMNAYCTNIAALFGGSATARENCISSESASKVRVDRVWSQTPENIRDVCSRTAAVAGTSSNYTALSGCLALRVGGEWLDGNLRLVR